MTAVSITLEGNLADDPELRFTPAGKAVASFTVVTSKSYKDENDKWQDKDTTFWRCSAWDIMAENAAESLRKGDSVMVTGSVASRSYETREGEKRTVTEVQAYNVGASIKRKQVKIDREARTNPKAPAQDDPWATPPLDEPPF